jgi:hypothetical protein
MAITIQQMMKVKDKEEAPDTTTKCCHSCEAKGTLCKKMHREKYYESPVRWNNRRIPQIQEEDTTRCSQLGRNSKHLLLVRNKS